MSQSRDPKYNLDHAMEQEILDSVAGLDFGAVEITVHNGRVVSIEIRSKRRFDSQRREAAGDQPSEGDRAPSPSSADRLPMAREPFKGELRTYRVHPK